MDSKNKYMRRALSLARKGEGRVSPNPMVGAVIVKDNKIIGEGYHEYYGGSHAEINAIQSSMEDIRDAEMYVTLEPCSHYGKTPPCAEALIKRGIKKVYVAMFDPNPLVSGKGIEMLRNAGIHVEVDILKEEAEKLNEIFIEYITTKKPFVVMKTASTLDGKIAAHTGDSKWISCTESRKYVHNLRNRYKGIMVGVNTIIMDNPFLTTRLEEGGVDPIRIIIDSTGRIPLDSNVFNKKSSSEIIVVVSELADKEKIKKIEDVGANVIVTPIRENKVDLNFLMSALGERGIDSILLEGGGTLNFSAIREGIVHKVISFVSPKIVGGKTSLTSVEGEGIPYVKDAVKLKELKTYNIGEDIVIEGYI